MPRSKQVDERRKHLYAVAAQLFASQGYDKTSIRDIATAFNVETGSLYHYISSKEDLLLGICMDALMEALNGLEKVNAQPLSPLEKLRAAITEHTVLALEGGAPHRVLLAELKALSETNRARVVQVRDRYEALFDALLLGAQQAGLLREDVPVQHFRLALLGMMNWSIFWYQPDKQLRPDDLGKLYGNLFISGAGIGDIAAWTERGMNCRPA